MKKVNYIKGDVNNYLATSNVNESINKKEKIVGGQADGKTVEDLARQHHQFVGTIEKELKKGIKIEFEHTNDENKAKEIAMDHIDEFWDYYSNLEYGLKAMEKKLKQNKKDKKINEGILSVFNDLLNEKVFSYKK